MRKPRDLRVEVDEHAMLETATSSAVTIRVPVDLSIVGRSADANKKLHNSMLSVKELADRMWAGKDVEMIITAASSAYRNDSVKDLDLSVQRLLGKWGNRFLMDLRGCRSAIVHIDEAVEKTYSVFIATGGATQRARA